MGVDVPKQAMDFLQLCLVMDPNKRATCEDLLNHSYFDGFREWFEIELAVSRHDNTTSHHDNMNNF